MRAKEFLTIAIPLLLAGGAGLYGYGALNARVSAAEQRIERQDDVLTRIDRRTREIVCVIAKEACLKEGDH